MRFGATGRSRHEEVYGGWRSSRLAAFRIVRDVRLSGAGDAQCVLGDVLRDDAAGSGVRPVADLDGRDERRVHTGSPIGPDLGPMLLAPVVVGGDVARADVRVLADVGVTDVRQVRD